MVVKVAAPGRSFAGVAAYCLHDTREPGEPQPETSKRVEWTDTRNLPTDRPDRAAAMMAAAAQGESPRARRRFGQREHPSRLRDWLAGRPLDDATLAEYLAARFFAKLGGQSSPSVAARSTRANPDQRPVASMPASCSRMAVRVLMKA